VLLCRVRFQLFELVVIVFNPFFFSLISTSSFSSASSCGNSFLLLYSTFNIYYYYHHHRYSRLLVVVIYHHILSPLSSIYWDHRMVSGVRLSSVILLLNYLFVFCILGMKKTEDAPPARLITAALHPNTAVVDVECAAK